MNIQSKILYLRSRGLTQRDISRKTGIPQSSVSKIESGDQKGVTYTKGVALDSLVQETQEACGFCSKQLIAD